MSAYRNSLLGRASFAAAAVAISALLSGGVHAQQELDRIDIVVFGPPSLGAFLPPIIKAQGLDEANGLDIAFHERPPDAYATQFNSGEFQVGGSAALLTVGLADARGVEVTYLFNLFDFWGAVVTSDPEIETVVDLEGRTLAAATGTTNYQMFRWFAEQHDADPSEFSVVNTAPPGLVSYAMAQRADAVQLWEPAYTLLVAKMPEIRTLDLKLQETWEEFAGSPAIPYLGLAAHRSWAEENRELVPRLYATYKAAAEWVQDNPEEAARLIVPDATAEDQEAIASLIQANERLGLNVAPAGELKSQIEAVYDAGLAIGFLPSAPSEATIYAEPLE
jgi:NitT/TauT family transport system substrate-binding protein